MVAIKYRAEKDKACGKQQLVYKLSTCQQTIIESIERSPEVWMPIALKSYNTDKGRVDHVGKLLHGFPTLCRSCNWYNLYTTYMVQLDTTYISVNFANDSEFI